MRTIGRWFAQLGISASIFLECFSDLVYILWPQKRRLEEHDFERPQRHSCAIEKKSQLLVICFLFASGLAFVSVDCWASNRAAMRRLLSPQGDVDAWMLVEKESRAIRAGVAAFMLSGWFGTGFMVSSSAHTR